jgi:hypothetical protein
LRFQFLDTDDILQSNLLRIELLIALSTRAAVVNMERGTRSFGKLTTHRLRSICARSSPLDFAVKRPKIGEPAAGYHWLADGKLEVSNTQPCGFLPVLFKFDYRIFTYPQFDPRAAIFSRSGIAVGYRPIFTMSNVFMPYPIADFLVNMIALSELYTGSIVYTVPLTDVPGYYYRQWGGSDLHRAGVESTEECVLDRVHSETSRGPLFADLVGILVDSNIDTYERIYGTITGRRPELVPTVVSLLNEVNRIRAQLADASAEYRRESARLSATGVFVPGVSWPDTEL